MNGTNWIHQCIHDNGNCMYFNLNYKEVVDGVVELKNISYNVLHNPIRSRRGEGLVDQTADGSSCMKPHASYTCNYTHSKEPTYAQLVSPTTAHRFVRSRAFLYDIMLHIARTKQ